MVKVIFDWIRSKDDVNPKSSGKLHFNGDYEQKTLLGGILSLFVSGQTALLFPRTTLARARARTESCTEGRSES